MLLDNTDNKNHFEIQSTIAGKMNLFLTDTLGPHLDSVIDILESNPGNMEDADLQLIFAHIAAGNFTTAASKIDALPSGRADWEALLNEVLELAQDTTDGIYALRTDADDREFFWGYASSDTLEGRALSQALLKEACDSSYTEPHALPEGESARPENQTGMQELVNSEQTMIEVFPNPTESGVFIRTSDSFSGCSFELRDLLGKQICTNFISDGANIQFLSLKDLNNGMYLLNVIKDKITLYKAKIIKN